MKKFILLIFCGLLFSVTNVRAQTWKTWKCGDNVFATLYERTLIISGEGEMYDYLFLSDIPWFTYKTYITEVIITEGVTTIGKQTFYYCPFLVSLTIPESVTSIGDYAFYDCRSLTSATIPNGVTFIGDGAFSDCRSLPSVAIPNSVTSIGNHAFENCFCIKSVHISSSVRFIGDFAFSNCWVLSSVTVEWTVPLDISDEVFLGNHSRRVQLIVPKGVENDYAVAPGWKSFDVEGSTVLPSGSCGVNLTWEYDNNGTLTISGTGDITNYPSDFAPWQKFCYEIHTLSLPEGLTSIGNYAFSRFQSLSYITIPEGVVTIGIGAFSNCSGLIFLSIPSSVTTIGAGAFEFCYNLTTVIVNWTVPLNISDNVFYGFQTLLIRLFVPSKSFDLYKNANVWNMFDIRTDEAVMGVTSQVKPLVKLYPNPTDGQFILHFDTPGTYNVIITSMSGTILLRQSFSDQMKHIDISNYPSGVYLLVVDDGKRKRAMKILKE